MFLCSCFLCEGERHSRGNMILKECLYFIWAFLSFMLSDYLIHREIFIILVMILIHLFYLNNFSDREERGF